MVRIIHNLDPNAFRWLWAKYVRGINDSKHCTNSLRGRYSRRLTKRNPDLSAQRIITLDEDSEGSFYAIYLCGVSKTGYRRHENYPHNVHAAIQPLPGMTDSWTFENWRLEVQNGRFMHIPGEDEIPAQYRDLPPEYTTCRIFRWAVCNPPRS